MDFAAPALLEGTPKGRNWFYRMWLRGKDPQDQEVESFGGPSWQNPFIPREEVERLAKEMPERRYRQEILAEFLDDEGAVFRGVRQCVSGFSKEPTEALGVDLARTQDFTVVIGMDKQGAVTHFDRWNEISWPLQKDRIAAAARKFNCRVLIDSTGVGDAPTQDLQKAGLRVEGFKFTNATKQQLVEALVIAMEQGEITLPDEPVLLNELEAFEFTTTASGLTRYAAPEGLHDDCVVALALARHAITTELYDMEALGRA
jgi:hypothetical protein